MPKQCREKRRKKCKHNLLRRAFWGKKISDTENVTIEQAKKHPVWNMGDKNLIDSASLMNKALEIIEARWLFDLEPEKIKVIIHPQSIIHAIIENIDGSCIASLSTPDMKDKSSLRSWVSR